MTAKTVTRENISYSGIAGLVIGLLLSAFYCLATIGPIHFPNSDLVAFGLFVASLIFGKLALDRPRYSTNYRLGGHYERVLDQTWNPPSNFTVAMGWSTLPIFIGTLGYIVGCWCGFWG